MSVTSKMVHVVTCQECSVKDQFDDLTVAQAADEVHRLKHDTSRAVGATLKGRVFDPKAEGHWYGIIWDAVEVAKAEGYAYIHWNGNVYETIGTDMTRPVCQGKDVPGLEKW